MHTIQTKTEPVTPRPVARRTVAGFVALVAVAALAAGAWLFERPPAVAGADAPAAAFSATRAWPDLRKIAGGGPTPTGSRGAREVRAHLVTRLTELGLTPQFGKGAGAHSFGGDIIAGVAENVIATIPGTDPTGRVVLAAHYDSTPTTPGTSDDKASVAAILEIVRALTSGGERLRNDLVILLSDGEEPGLIGAEAFSRHPLGRDGGVMINLEGPGNAAPSAVYNITPGGTGLVGIFGAAPHPVGESALIGAYRGTGFHSDLTALEDHGFIGLDLGFAGGRAFYHHPQDTVDRFSPAALQMHGDNALAMVRAAGQADLPSLRSAGDDTFFAAFGLVFRYPGWLVWPLAALGLLAVLALAVVARVRRVATVPRMLVAAVSGLVPVVLAYLAGDSLWKVMGAIEPGYTGMVYGEPYRPELFRLSLIAMAVAPAWGWVALLRRRLGAVALTVGALFWPALAGVAFAALMPGMSYYGALPALAGGLAGLAALALRSLHVGAGRAGSGPGPEEAAETTPLRRAAPYLALGAEAVGAGIAVVILTVGARAIGAASGIAMAGYPAVLLGLAALALVPSSPPPHPPPVRQARGFPVA
ncbi:M20/M25/M40 family metallo-hydrolase [Nonomuraea sp. NBC_01738]|uniref:M20/M25/M40 family metallo-hydrolase n=1 Tax=Nonomuraea sp. NBC_01738 TaxID=2976003 RepID=UPI002E155725|nr:M20/M25/M40 family metallo-hydrolase [Nonomuraea sp. NBC_01738]